MKSSAPAAGGSQDGIRVGSRSTVAFNTANDNGEDGVEVSCPSFMAHNTASNNGAENFNLVGDGCTDVDNTSPDEDSCTENTLAAC